MATPPLLQMKAMKASDFFTYGMRLLALHPPHLTDWALVEQMRRIGLVANAEFGALDAAVRSTLEGIPEAGQQAMQEAIPRMANIVNGWQSNLDTIGVYSNFYMKRAIIAMLGLGSNEAAAAVYPRPRPRCIRSCSPTATATLSAATTTTSCTSTLANCRPSVRSGQQRSTTRTGSRFPTRSTDSRSGTVTHSTTTTTARLTSTSRTSVPVRTWKRTGFPHLEVPSACFYGSTCQPREFSTENGYLHPSANAESTAVREIARSISLMDFITESPDIDAVAAVGSPHDGVSLHPSPTAQRNWCESWKLQPLWEELTTGLEDLKGMASFRRTGRRLKAPS